VNSKRQTVWLVSMLSLMVVLSAYYLFTEDVSELNMADGLNGKEITMNSIELNGQTGANNLAGAADGKSADQLILEKYNETLAASGANFFTSMYLDREEKYFEEVEKWSTIIDDPEQKTEAVTEAWAEMTKMEEQMTLIKGIEDQLRREFQDALINQENNRWKVFIQSDKLERSQAASIIDMVSQQLKVGPHQISIQYTP
jgi:stage III sporulation protein AH